MMHDLMDAQFDLDDRCLKMIQRLRERVPIERHPSTPTTLTVFFLLMDGASQQSIARQFACSRTTVWTRVRHIRQLWLALDAEEQDG